MKLLITGVDGYIGWPLALKLGREGHEIAGVDNFARRAWVEEMGSISALPIAGMADRLKAYEAHVGRPMTFFEGDLANFEFTQSVFEQFRPDAVVFLGQMPSAPYSMIDAAHAIYTQKNNVLGALATLFAIRDTVPDCHLIKLGTMGEYGTPNVDIPEGFFELTFRGRTDRALFPRKAGSFYHQSKVHDTHNVEMACRLWDLRATDIMQGVVYGTRFSEDPQESVLNTRFDFDACFGTVINRFCTQAVIGMPLTPYGKGTQKRGFLPLRDSLACLTLAIEHPVGPGEYRTLNQFDRVYSVNQLAETVRESAVDRGLDVVIQPIDNPRIEQEEHHYQPDAQLLRDLGYRPSGDLKGDVAQMLEDLFPVRDRIEAYREILHPNIDWDARRRDPASARA